MKYPLIDHLSVSRWKRIVPVNRLSHSYLTTMSLVSQQATRLQRILEIPLRGNPVTWQC